MTAVRFGAPRLGGIDLIGPGSGGCTLSPYAEALKAWHAAHPQLCQRGMPLRARIRLLQSVVWATCAWGLESLNLTKLLQRRLDGVQRKMTSGLTWIARKPDEDPPSYSRDVSALSMA